MRWLRVCVCVCVCTLYTFVCLGISYGNTYIGLLIDMQQMPLPPSIYQRLTSSSTLMNLAHALAYHKMYVPSAFAQKKFPIYIFSRLFVQMLTLENCIGFHLFFFLVQRFSPVCVKKKNTQYWALLSSNDSFQFLLGFGQKKKSSS